MKIIILTAVLLASGMAFSQIPIEKVKCGADTNNGKRINLKVYPGLISDNPSSNQINYNGNNILVTFRDDNPSASAQVLWILLNDYTTRVHFPKKESVYIFDAPNGVRITCYFEK